MKTTNEKRILLVARHSLIEPLGLLHMAGIAKQEGWTPKIVLVKDYDFSSIDEVVSQFSPNAIGFSVYTGNHQQTFSYIDSLRAKHPDLTTILGGPHVTYFPKESREHADYTVLSEGFNAFRRILRGEAQTGILGLVKQEPFPAPDREGFYKDHPEHAASPIKSVITQTGCPYSCTYCYNSGTLEEIARELPERDRALMADVLKPTGRLFPRSYRPVDDIIAEINEIMSIAPLTRMIYFQDDVFGSDIKWVREFVGKYHALSIPFHAQIRFELANPDTSKGKERLELLREANCTGMTLAIESASPAIRREVLNRNMDEELMFKVLSHMSGLGYKVRTEQMLGLPYGATTQQTAVNLDADLETLELNVRLKEETGLPTMAWASIFAPYYGTQIWDYCKEHGFYERNNEDISDSFFERSVLRFPRRWVGPKLSAQTSSVWMDESELGRYKDNLQTLRNLFNYFALVPKGHKLARKYLNGKGDDQFLTNLSTTTRHHLYNEVLYDIV